MVGSLLSWSMRVKRSDSGWSAVRLCSTECRPMSAQALRLPLM